MAFLSRLAIFFSQTRGRERKYEPANPRGTPLVCPSLGSAAMGSGGQAFSEGGGVGNFARLSILPRVAPRETLSNYAVAEAPRADSPRDCFAAARATFASRASAFSSGAVRLSTLLLGLPDVYLNSPLTQPNVGFPGLPIDRRHQQRVALT